MLQQCCWLIVVILLQCCCSVVSVSLQSCCNVVAVRCNLLSTMLKRVTSKSPEGMINNVNIYYLCILLVVLPTKASKYVFTGVGLCVCLSVCLSVCDHDNRKDCGRICTKFYGRFLGGKVRPSLCFVMTSTGMWK